MVMRLGLFKGFNKSMCPVLRAIRRLVTFFGSIHQPELERIHANLASQLGDYTFNRKGGHWRARCPVRGRTRPVDENVVTNGFHVIGPVTSKAGHATKANPAALEGTTLVLEQAFHGGDGAIFFSTDLDPHAC